MQACFMGSLVRDQQLVGITMYQSLYPQHSSTHAHYLWRIHDIRHVTLSPRPSRFSRATLKSWEWPGDKARTAVHVGIQAYLSLHYSQLFTISWEKEGWKTVSSLGMRLYQSLWLFVKLAHINLPIDKKWADCEYTCKTYPGPIDKEGQDCQMNRHSEF